MKNKLLIVLFAFATASCHKEEIAIAPHASGDATTNHVEIGQDYRTQLYFDFSSNSIASSNLKTEWDIAFESGENGFHVVLNTSRGMAVHKSNLDFENLLDESGVDWSWDASSGKLDSTGVGNWQLNNGLYLFDMGYSYTGSHLGYYKLNILSVTSTTYEIEYGELTSTHPTSATITKDNTKSFTHFSFLSGIVQIAPPKEDWDIVFTQYTHIFFEPDETPYVVTGALINRFNTTGAKITTIPFEDVTYEDVMSLSMESNLDAIGYEWKYFDFEAEVYTVDPYITYIIHSNDGFYYKLHFVDFYNDQGIKGFPKFEFQQL